HEVTAAIVLVTTGRTPPGVSGLRVATDRMRGAGPLGGIYTAIQIASPGLALVVACDMPFLTASFLRRLVAEAAGADAAVPRTADGQHPLCAVYAPSAAEPIRRRIEGGRLKVNDALADLRVRELGPKEIARYDPDGTLFFNINTPDDYKRALAVAGRG
ncbi:MAG: molybdenum cofactor guanylyltransferase, partial [Acidobacteria bacterium]|nr:molybdenum cofactor guanylyltransferase [Acidobacteriota bacterium]